ncbi:MAG TPA: hypothetical protein VFJ43_15640, partial [Bacteroidia bacterium]|nr:hypothetical protein [Bacteroidia bacterium]
FSKKNIMKKFILTSLIALTIVSFDCKAQETKKEPGSETYGNTLNLGVGIGYYGYVGHTLPVVHADYEFNVARNFTLAPFVTVYRYQNYYYWGNPNYPYRNYSYTQTVIPIGVKGSYYFDQLLHAGPRWDFYLGASLGFAIRKTVWESGYYGETTVISHGTSGLYLDGHIGTEFHMNDKLGLYLDLSSGISTFGLAIHL